MNSPVKDNHRGIARNDQTDRKANTQKRVGTEINAPNARDTMTKKDKNPSKNIKTESNEQLTNQIKKDVKKASILPVKPQKTPKEIK